eukprot:scaffold910_cov396-Prasinococcus_capsulatus_cf.AAC.68
MVCSLRAEKRGPSMVELHAQRMKAIEEAKKRMAEEEEQERERKRKKQDDRSDESESGERCVVAVTTDAEIAASCDEAASRAELPREPRVH